MNLPRPAPAITVIVPVHNAEATLARCVDSVLSQSVAGALCCVLVDDGSSDGSGALCDRYAVADNRVAAVHQPCRGVSAARNAGLCHAAAADAEYIVFLDSDDALLPGALQTALDAQRTAPDAFVLWHYTTEWPGGALSSAASAASPRPQSALARLYLDCLIAMPWNKLYRGEYARRLRFDPAYSLGEDLRFVLDYLALLGQNQPEFCYAVVEAPLTFYDCSRTDGTLSTRYLPDYCAVWCAHYQKLNAACTAAGIPAEDRLPLHRAELRVVAEGVADLLRRDPAQAGIRHDKAVTALCHPWLRALLDEMKREKCYSPYYLPVRWRNLHLLYTLAEAKRTGSRWYGRLDWLGYYLFGGRRKRG